MVSLMGSLWKQGASNWVNIKIDTSRVSPGHPRLLYRETLFQGAKNFRYLSS